MYNTRATTYYLNTEDEQPHDDVGEMPEAQNNSSTLNIYPKAS